MIKGWFGVLGIFNTVLVLVLFRESKAEISTSTVLNEDGNV
jgi:hypothetical protein